MSNENKPIFNPQLLSSFCTLVQKIFHFWFFHFSNYPLRDLWDLANECWKFKWLISQSCSVYVLKFEEFPKKANLWIYFFKALPFTNLMIWTHLHVLRCWCFSKAVLLPGICTRCLLQKIFVNWKEYLFGAFLPDSRSSSCHYLCSESSLNTWYWNQRHVISFSLRFFQFFH